MPVVGPQSCKIRGGGELEIRLAIKERQTLEAVEKVAEVKILEIMI